MSGDRPTHEELPGSAPPAQPSHGSWPGAAPAPARTADGAGTPAEFGPRAQAAVIDFFIRLLIVVVPAALGAILFVVSEGAGFAGLGLGALVGFVLSIAYAPWMIAKRNGQTIGHRISGTRVVAADGSALSGGKAFVREFLVKGLLIESVGGLTLYILPLLNYLWPLWDAQNEALHDKLCSTRVVEA